MPTKHTGEKKYYDVFRCLRERLLKVLTKRIEKDMKEGKIKFVPK